MGHVPPGLQRALPLLVRCAPCAHLHAPPTFTPGRSLSWGKTCHRQRSPHEARGKSCAHLHAGVVDGPSLLHELGGEWRRRLRPPDVLVVEALAEGGGRWWGGTCELPAMRVPPVRRQGFRLAAIGRTRTSVGDLETALRIAGGGERSGEKGVPLQISTLGLQPPYFHMPQEVPFSAFYSALPQEVAALLLIAGSSETHAAKA